MDELLNLLAPWPIKLVYPAYIAFQIKKALVGTDPEGIITSVGDVQSLGNSRYGIEITDKDGATYHVVVAVAE